MPNPAHSFRAPLWEMPSAGALVFVSLPVDASDAIKAIPRPPRPGFGSLRVTATIGGTVWSTSIFPDSKGGCYVLPVKKAVRSAERIDLGDAVEVSVAVLE